MSERPSDEERRVRRELADGVLLLTLDRPRRKNAFDDAQWIQLRDALDEAREDPDVGVVVVTGAGGEFSAGQDLSSFMPAGDPAGEGAGDGATAREGIQAHPFQQCMDSLCAFDKPLLAAATGVAVGIGATFLYHCDLVYVGQGLRLRMPFVSLGLVPEAASSYLLQATIGQQRAAELFFTAEWVGAERAVEVGIAARAYPDDELLEAVLAKAREMARWPVSSLQATKRCLMAAHRAGIQAAREAENAGMVQQAGSPENIEAVMAFLQKREPDFRKLRSEKA
ncbi:MAG: enoyl-CoA hydratase-related protein [Myxococcota bacterium]